MTSSVTTEYAPHRLREKERAENFPVAMLFLPAAIRPRSGVDLRRGTGHRRPGRPGERGPRGPAGRVLRATWSASGRARRPARPWCSDSRPPSRAPARQAGVRPAGRSQPDRPAGPQVSDVRRSAGVLHALRGTRRSPGPRGVRPVDRAGPRRLDRICVALQLVEPWQDVAEDRRNWPVVPAAGEPAQALDVPRGDLDETGRRPPRCRLVADEALTAPATARQRASLVAELLRGWARGWPSPGTSQAVEPPSRRCGARTGM